MVGSGPGWGQPGDVGDTVAQGQLGFSGRPRDRVASRLSSVAAVSSVSSTVMRPGCSFWAVWINAHTAACARSGARS